MGESYREESWEGKRERAREVGDRGDERERAREGGGKTDRQTERGGGGEREGEREERKRMFCTSG